jgi:hypothetical protein
MLEKEWGDLELCEAPLCSTISYIIGGSVSPSSCIATCLRPKCTDLATDPHLGFHELMDPSTRFTLGDKL